MSDEVNPLNVAAFGEEVQAKIEAKLITVEDGIKPNIIYDVEEAKLAVQYASENKISTEEAAHRMFQNGTFVLVRNLEPEAKLANAIWNIMFENNTPLDARRAAFDAAESCTSIPAQLDALGNAATAFNKALWLAIYLRRSIAAAMDVGVLKNAEKKQLKDTMKRLVSVIDWASREFK